MLVVRTLRVCAMGFKNMFSKSWSQRQSKTGIKLKKRTRNKGRKAKEVEPAVEATSVVGMTEPTGGGATGSGAHTLRSSTPEKSGGAAEKKGWLLKWTNYIKGYQRRWFVLSKGVLSYYRNQAEINHTCRGTISLHGALIHTVDSCTFVISNGGTQTFHIKTASEVERQSWVTALELAKAKAISAMENDELEEKETAQVVPSEEINTVVRDLSDRLENLRTCYDLIIKHGVALQRALSDLESNEEESLLMRTKIVNERATLFRITSNAMINACNDYLRCAESQGHKWSKMLQHERDQRQHLEDMVEQLAKQHTRLEQAAHLVQHNKNTTAAVLLGAVASTASVVSDDEIEFFDAEEHQVGGMFDNLPQARGVGGEDDEEDESAFVMKMSKQQKRRNSSQEQEQAHTSSSSGDEASGHKTHKHAAKEELKLAVSKPDPDTKNPLVASAHSGNPFPGNPGNSPQDLEEQSLEDCICTHCEQEQPSGAADTVDEAPAQSRALVAAAAKSVPQQRQRRTRVPEKPNYPLNLWSIMKNCIGKELSKIPMPVNFNEPLSMLQRLTEDYEYADLLDVAANCSDECEQLAYVAAFTISSYSTTAHRTGKPFNPLLGETYECDRTDDLGWRCISEQVSHHPPMAAIHCEGKKWICWQEFTMTSKFRGKYLQVIPMGGAYVKFPQSGHKFTWRKVTTTVNNIIVGKLWVDQHGDMEIKGTNAAEGLKCHLKYIPYSYFSRETQRRVKGVIFNRQNEAKWALRGTWDNKIEIAPVLGTSGASLNTDSSVYKTGPYKTVWQRRMPPPDSEKYYNFTLLACQLNEMEEGVAPTDSRMRPDQRLMEDGRWDESNAEKLRLEDKQRLKRRARETEAEEAAAEGREISSYEPIWFKRVQEEGSDNFVHVYKGTYWEHKKSQDWSQCPDLF